MDSLPNNNCKIKVGTKDNLLPKCILCNKVPENGIRDGFLLLNQFICSSCEDIILSLSYNDPIYNEMVQQLKDAVYKRKKRI